jgi:pyruvate/2-oxoglutarate dehydrogenase complex dihydrolipoamide acyltransferase (E2) component
MITAIQRRLFATTTSKVSPSTWFYFLNYGIKPEAVTATGPKGHITKGDLLAYIRKNNLQMVQHKVAATA